MVKKGKAILYIDGENFRYYLKKVCDRNNHQVAIETFHFDRLFETVLRGIDPVERRYYSAKLRFHPGFKQKSNELIQRQRALKTNLEKQGFAFVVGGSVRGQQVPGGKKDQVVFHEKGVDVRIAVDIVSESCDSKVDTVVLCSSDSDLQPAVYEAKNRGIEVVYLGFEAQPNKGLIYTGSRALLIRDAEILESIS